MLAVSITFVATNIGVCRQAAAKLALGSYTNSYEHAQRTQLRP